MKDESLNEPVLPVVAAAQNDAPSFAMTLSAQFMADVTLVYQDLSITNPEEFLSILVANFDKKRVERQERDDRFSSELHCIYASEILPPLGIDVLLSKLGHQLDAWREQTVHRLTELFSGIPADDPLRCPVSLFGAMDYGRLETAHTRAFAWMLDPRKEHGFGCELAKALLLLPHFHGPGFTDKISVDDVWAEYQIDDGRLDVLVYGNSLNSEGTREDWLLLVEAKVDAFEGDRQLRRYDKWIAANAHGRQVYRVFLTPDGRDPETSNELWIRLSFPQVACAFRKASSVLSNEPGYHFLRYYLSGLLKDVCLWPLPMHDPATCLDPYSVLKYLETVHESEGIPL